MKEINTNHGDVKAIQYLPNFSEKNRLIASGGTNCEICIWNEETGVLIERILGHTGVIYDLKFSRKGDIMVSSSKSLKIWTRANVEGKSYYLLDKNISKS